jgi:hypothetical protein
MVVVTRDLEPPVHLSPHLRGTAIQEDGVAVSIRFDVNSTQKTLVPQ